MRKYMTPEMEYVKFQVKDVLAASGGGFKPDAQEGNGWNAGQGNEGFELG